MDTESKLFLYYITKVNKDIKGKIISVGEDFKRLLNGI